MSLLIRYNNVPFVSVDNKLFAFVFLSKLVVALVVLVVLVILVLVLVITPILSVNW